VVYPPSFSNIWRWLAAGAICLGVALCAPRASAQVYDATQLGQPRIDLGAGWLVHAGDDPAYARSDFDDSHWLPFNAATDSLHTLFPHSRPEIVWYRLHLKVPPRGPNLALREYQLSSAFVVYTDGVPLLQVGSIAPFTPYDNSARLMAKIPGDQVATGFIVIALRVRLSPVDWVDAYPGLRDWKLALGEDEGLAENTWLQTIGESLLWWLGDLTLIGLMLGALLLYSAQRRRTEYLWLFLWGLASLLPLPLNLFSMLHTFPASLNILIGLSDLFSTYFMARMYLAFIDRPIGWRLHVYLVFASVTIAVIEPLFFVGALNTVQFAFFQAPLTLLISVILPVILIARARRGNRDAGILLVPLFLTGLYWDFFYGALLLSQIPGLRYTAWRFFQSLRYMPVGPLPFGPFNLNAQDFLNILAPVTLALIILLRTNRVSRQQAILEAEVANARAVQQVILPDHAETVPGYEVESVYEPAQQVGGDFFQVLPDGAGGLLVVIGDVAGKGLPAAMLVSVLVGAIRTAAAYSQVPAEILAQLNDRLMGRTDGGFATAMAVSIAAGGAVTIANAGHLPPYLDGRELDLPGALPLGIISGTHYETTQLQLAPGSRLTFYSDGVIEAQNERRELFGFDRGTAISSRPAAEIAAAAKQFGQSDDITVVAIRRSAAIATAA
jgi:hypothetical protein